MKVIIVGGHSFGAQAAERVSVRHEVLAAWTEEDDRLGHWAFEHNVPILPEPTPDFLAEFGADLLVGAHNTRYLSKAHREACGTAIGYHPSLLPRHRGVDAVRWTIEHGDPIAGGTVYELDDGWDTGPILMQKFCHVRPDDDASSLWKRELFPMGLRLITSVLDWLEQMPIETLRKPQDEAVATFEEKLVEEKAA